MFSFMFTWVMTCHRTRRLLFWAGVVVGFWLAGSVGLSVAAADEQADWLAALQRVARGDPAADAAGAVDGQINGQFGFHTDQQQSPWWQVDLGQAEPLARVVVFNRTVAAERAQQLLVRVSTDGLAWKTVYRHEGPVYYGHRDGKPLVVECAGVTARCVRLQVESNTWLHLDEVQVYGVADSQRNLALQRPATQSSISAWSRKTRLAGDVARAELVRNIALGGRAVRPLLEACGVSAAGLAAQLTQLEATGCSLDDARWVRLFVAARKLEQRWVAVRGGWQMLDLSALRLAIEDLIHTFGPRYAGGRDFLQRLDRVEADRVSWAAGLERGEPEALRRAEEVLALQQAALLANPLLDCEQLLVVKRPESAPAAGLPANFHGNESLPRNGFDDELVSLSPIGPSGQLTTVYRPGNRFVGDVDLHYDGRRVLFSSLDDAAHWRIFEINVDGTGLRQPLQVAEPDVDNYDPCYLPDGNILFVSTATYIGVPCVFGASHVGNFYASDERTGDVRRLTFDQDHNWTPTVLEDGRVLYLRWEYTDLAHPNSRILFTMNPDGTRQMALYGTNSYFPNSFFCARAIPDGSGRIAGIATGHHGTARSGRLLLLDPSRGVQEAEGVVQEIPGRGRTVEATVRDRLVDGIWPQLVHPYPLGDRTVAGSAGKYFLVSAKLSPSAPWAIYLVDVFDNFTLIKQLPGSSLFEPIPVASRPAPPQLTSRREPAATEATVYLADVYRGGGLAGVPRGAVKQLRVITYYYASRGVGGLLGSIGMDGPWDIKQVLGTVPVRGDGSALFTVPANTPIAVQPLDAEGKALQQMRSWFVGMPGEVVSCVGCHEQPKDATLNLVSHALEQQPDRIQPWYGPRRGFSFAREVQPVLDHYCVQCHDGREGRSDLRGDRQITDWNSQIAGHVSPEFGGKFSVAYAELHRFVRRPGIESDLHMLPPLDFHADTTELVQMLRQGHYGVQLDRESWDRLVTWIDLNAPYHGTWSEIVGVERAGPAVQRRRELERRYGPGDVDWERIEPVARLAAPNPPPAGQPPVAPSPDATAIAVADAPAEVGPPMTPVTRRIELGDGVTMDLALIPAGRLLSGGSAVPGAAAGVVVDRPFWMGTCEVTNQQFARFDPQHDSRLESRHGYQFGRLGYPLNEPRQPVVRVSWHEANAFCEWLGTRADARCALPTEAQWEHACRAGTTTPFFFGDGSVDFGPWANLGDQSLRQYAACTAFEHYSNTRLIPNPNRYDDWVPKDDRFEDGSFLAAEVGSYQPNPWALYDMHGNVWEWTSSLESASASPDESGTGTGVARRVVRGGSWYDRPARAASRYRLGYRPYHRVFNVGFRVVMEIEPEQAQRLLSHSDP